MNAKVKTVFSILAIISIILFCFSISPVTLQNDTFYTIKVGEHIVQNGIDMQDPFSWHEGLAYTYPHWLYDVGMYLIYQVGGMVVIYLSTVILACILGIVIYLINCKLSKNQLVSFIMTLAVMYLLKNFIAARAQLVTFILFALTVLCIEQYLQTKKKRYAVCLIVIPILIANLHCAVWPFYFVIYLPYIAEYIICVISDSDFWKRFQMWRYKAKVKKAVKKQQNEKVEMYIKKIGSYEEKIETARDNRKQRRKEPYRLKLEKRDATKGLILIFVICLFTGLLTPLHGTPYTYLYDTMQGNTTQSINEHQPLTIINDKDLMVLLVVVFAILIFTDTKIRLCDLFMLGGLLFMTFMSQRQMSMFFIIGGFAITRLIVAICDKYDKEGVEEVTKFIVSLPGKIILLAFIAVISLYFLRQVRDDSFISEYSYPVKAADYIVENLDLENIRLYNEYNYGSYLIFRGIPVFIDSRADLYAPEFNKKGSPDGEGKDIFSDYINISSIGTYYETKFEEYGITHLIMYKNAKLNMFISRDNNYKQLYEDDRFVIYERLNAND